MCVNDLSMCSTRTREDTILIYALGEIGNLQAKMGLRLIMLIITPTLYRSFLV